MTVAKNYLTADELDQLNRIVGMTLDFAELRAKQRQNLRMADWRSYVDKFLTFNEQPILQGKPLRSGCNSCLSKSGSKVNVQTLEFASRLRGASFWIGVARPLRAAWCYLRGRVEK